MVAEHLPTTLSILDPFAGIGLGIARRLAEESPHLRVLLYSTDETPEHRVLAMAEQAAVVTPLRCMEELTGSRAVVTCRHPANPWDKRLMEWLNTHPEVAWLDLSQPGIAGGKGNLAVGPPTLPPETRTWIHLPDPGLAGPLAILEALAPLEPFEAQITLLQPCSQYGAGGIEELAVQARARLSGETPPRSKVLPAVLAFDLAPGPLRMEEDLSRQVAALHPGLSTRIRVVQAGVFFGHTALVELLCPKDVRARRLRDLLNSAPTVRVVRDSRAVMPSQVVDESDVLVWNPTAVQNRVSLWTATDGGLTFGAELALRILATLTTA